MQHLIIAAFGQLWGCILPPFTGQTQIVLARGLTWGVCVCTIPGYLPHKSGKTKHSALAKQQKFPAGGEDENYGIAGVRHATEAETL